MSKDTCAYSGGCDSPAYAKGYCVKHYARLRRHGDPAGPRGSDRLCFVCGGPVHSGNTLGICRKTLDCRNARAEHFRRAWGMRPRKQRVPCIVEGCLNLNHAYGYCDMHWTRIEKTGDPGPAGHIRSPKITLLAGEVFGRWTALESYVPGPDRILCRCECGTERKVSVYTLRKGKSQSCGCLRGRSRRYRPRQVPYLSAAAVSGRLTALEDAMYSKDEVPCRCECGVVLNRVARDIKHLHVRSCGCLRGHKNYIHGLSKHPLYGTWQGIMRRTSYPWVPEYPNYGGRGITMHEPWRDVRVFVTDIERLLGPRPKGHTLDRYPDKDGNYEPGNVRWATAKQQTDNRRKIAELTRERDELREQLREASAALERAARPWAVLPRSAAQPTFLPD